MPSKRDSATNVMLFKCLFFDIDSPIRLWILFTLILSRTWCHRHHCLVRLMTLRITQHNL